MTGTVDAVADLAVRISDIRRRLNELESERVRLRNELDEATRRFAAMTTGIHEPTTGSGQMDAEILALFRRNPEIYFSRVDVESHLRRQNWNVDGPYIRTKLSRLAKRGKIRKVGHGRYADKG